MEVKTKLVKMYNFFNNELITVKCSPSQRLVKYILFKNYLQFWHIKFYGHEHNFGTVINFIFYDAVYCNLLELLLFMCVI